MYWKLTLSVVGLCLLVALGSVAAASISVDETDLEASGEVYEVNLGDDGLLYVSDYGAGQVWVVNPATNTYIRYDSIDEVTDARPDAGGDIWFTDYGTIFSTVDVSAGTVTHWDMHIFNPSVEYNLSGLAFDTAGRVWISEWTGSTSNLYRFDPSSREFCTYDLPGGSISDYVLYHNDTVWLANSSEDRIYRFNPTTGQATYWSLPSGQPLGLDFDASGNLWWADYSSNQALRRLEPGLSRLSTFTLPTGTRPRMVAEASDGQIWYSEEGSGTLGALDPDAATSTVSTLSSNTVTAPVSCQTLGIGATATASTTSGTLPWTDNTWTTIHDTGGWTVYGLPAGGSPYGVALAADYTWVSDQGRQKLVRTLGAAPLAAPVLAIAASDPDVVLSWNTVQNAQSYQVWSSETPYFAPGDTGSQQLIDTTETSYTHTGVLNQLNGLYYYVRSAVGDQVSPLSNHTGKFSFALAPGSS